MAETPEDAELGRAAARSFPSGGDEGGHRRDVIRIGRVAQSEQRRNEEDDEDRAAVRHGGDVIVETEHG